MPGPDVGACSSVGEFEGDEGDVSGGAVLAEGAGGGVADGLDGEAVVRGEGLGHGLGEGFAGGGVVIEDVGEGVYGEYSVGFEPFDGLAEDLSLGFGLGGGARVHAGSGEVGVPVVGHVAVEVYAGGVGAGAGGDSVGVDLGHDVHSEALEGLGVGLGGGLEVVEEVLDEFGGRGFVAVDSSEDEGDA